MGIFQTEILGISNYIWQPGRANSLHVARGQNKNRTTGTHTAITTSSWLSHLGWVALSDLGSRTQELKVEYFFLISFDKSEV